MWPGRSGFDEVHSMKLRAVLRGSRGFGYNKDEPVINEKVDDRGQCNSHHVGGEIVEARVNQQLGKEQVGRDGEGARSRIKFQQSPQPVWHNAVSPRES